MNADTVKPPRRAGLPLALALAAAAAAVSAALIWSGSSAVATVAEVAASSSDRASRHPDGPAAAPAPTGTPQAPGAAHHQQTPGPASASPLQEMPQESSGPGAGDKPEVSLEEAGRAEVGYAARSGKDPSRNLPKAGTASPGDILGAAPALGGCLAEYGDAGQCLPAVPPSLARHLQEMKDAGADPASMPHSWTCDEARKYFPNGLPVRQAGADPQKLDTDADGIACGPAD